MGTRSGWNGFSDTLESDSSHSDDDIEICEKIDARIIKYDPSREIMPVTLIVSVYGTLNDVNVSIPFHCQDRSDRKYGPMVEQLNNKSTTFSNFLSTIKSGIYVGKPFASFVMEIEDDTKTNKFCISESDTSVYQNVETLSSMSPTWSPFKCSVLIVQPEV